MRTEVVRDATITDMKVFEEKVALAREIADVLRKNVVQAQKQEAKDTWRTWNTSSALAFYVVLNADNIWIYISSITHGLHRTPYDTPVLLSLVVHS